MPLKKFNQVFGKIPLHFAIIFMCLLWLIPTIGLFVSSFRTREDVRTTGWWMAFTSKQVPGKVEYSTYCASCHGADGKKIPAADLSSAESDRPVSTGQPAAGHAETTHQWATAFSGSGIADRYEYSALHLIPDRGLYGDAFRAEEHKRPIHLAQLCRCDRRL